MRCLKGDLGEGNRIERLAKQSNFCGKRKLFHNESSYEKSQCYIQIFLQQKL